VPAKEVRVATYYEYACSCDWIRLLWRAWQDSKFPSWRNVRLAPGVWHLEPDLRKTHPVSVVLTELCRDGIPGEHSKECTGVIQRLIETIPRQLSCYEFGDICFAVPAFPTPWQNLDPKSKERLTECFNNPIWKDRAFSVLQPGEPVEAYRRDDRYKNGIFEAVVDWSRPKREILTSFNDWLVPNYKQLGPKPQAKGKREMASCGGYEHLRRLTAWRLYRSGLSAASAQRIMNAQSLNVPVADPTRGFPGVGSGQVWRNLHSAARNHCRKLFPYPPPLRGV
jgi:hypothetical protein